MNDSEESSEGRAFCTTALLENKVVIVITKHFHDAFFQGGNTRDKSEAADSKNG